MHCNGPETPTEWKYESPTRAGAGDAYRSKIYLMNNYWILEEKDLVRRSSKSEKELNREKADANSL